MKFEKDVFMNFDLSDLGGIVFFGNYYTIAHRLIEDFIRQSGISWNDWFTHPEWGVPLKHTECEYIKPLYSGKTYKGRVKVKKLGETSLQFECELIDKDQACCRIKTTHVFFDKMKKQKRPIPSEIRRVLETYLT